MISNREMPEQTIFHFLHTMIVYLLFPKLYDLYCHRLNEKIVTTCNDFFAMILTQFRDNSLQLLLSMNTSPV